MVPRSRPSTTRSGATSSPRPFLTDLYDYGKASLQREVMRHVPKFLAKYASAFQPPAELVFLDRVVVGHYGTLRRLGARGNWRSLLDEYIEPAAE